MESKKHRETSERFQAEYNGAYATEMLSTPEAVEDAVARIYGSTIPVARIAVDVEGADLCREGHIALVQVAVRELRKVFLFDVSWLGAEAFWGERRIRRRLGALLEDPGIVNQEARNAPFCPSQQKFRTSF